MTTEAIQIPDAPGIKADSDAIIQIRNLRKWYQVGGGFLGFGDKVSDEEITVLTEITSVLGARGRVD